MAKTKCLRQPRKSAIAHSRVKSTKMLQDSHKQINVQIWELSALVLFLELLDKIFKLYNCKGCIVFQSYLSKSSHRHYHEWN